MEFLRYVTEWSISYCTTTTIYGHGSSCLKKTRSFMKEGKKCGGGRGGCNRRNGEAGRSLREAVYTQGLRVQTPGPTGKKKKTPKNKTRLIFCDSVTHRDIKRTAGGGGIVGNTRHIFRLHHKTPQAQETCLMIHQRPVFFKRRLKD